MLQSETSKPSKAPKPPKEKKVKWLSITRLAQRHGMSVPVLKQLLASAGYMVGKDATEKAYREGVVEKRELAGADQFGREGPAFYLAWREDFVNRIALGSEQRRDPRASITTRFSAGNALAALADIIFDLELCDEYWVSSMALNRTHAQLSMLVYDFGPAHELLAEKIQPMRPLLEAAAGKSARASVEALAGLQIIQAVEEYLERQTRKFG